MILWRVSSEKFVLLQFRCSFPEYYDMNLTKKVTVSTLLWVTAALTASAAVKDLPVRTVNGKIYHYYEVQPKETVYSLCYRLGITKDELVKDNPAVADGLKAGMVLFFPYEDEPNRTNTERASQAIINHKVEKGETIFGIAKKYGVSTDELISQNPVLTEGLKAGQTITITTAAEESPNSVEKEAVSANPPVVKSVKGYIVQKKETFYSIARDNGITVAQLEEANPGVTTLKAGQVLNIPVNGSELTENTPIPQDAPINDPLPSTDLTAVTTITEIESSDGQESSPSEKVEKKSVSIAVLLPFMLKEENVSKGAQRYTEFYKGLLIAVDSMRNSAADIHIKAFDTEGSTDRVKEILASGELNGVNYILAPDNTDQIAMISDWGNRNDVKVINIFVVKSEAYLTNPNLMQGNLPSALMVDRAIDGMCERLKYSTPVFLSINNVPADKIEFTNQLKKSLESKGIAYKEISVDGQLTPANLKTLPTDGTYTFIPLSGKQADLNKLLPGIIEWRDDAVTPTVKVFGYPEWITYRGETLENMHKLNTTVYSRFYADEDAKATVDVEESYKRWYGSGMDAAVPRQGLLGFDTGMYLIHSIAFDEERYDGVQNGFHFITSSPGQGEFNDILYFINFRPGGQIDKYSL